MTPTPRLDIGAEAIKGTAGDPERDLAAAILHLALVDLEDPQRLRSGDSLDVLREARLFCFSSAPDWRGWREAWCDLAGVDPDFFQRQAAERCKVRW